MSACRPHSWHEPLPFDVALTCRRCGRELALDGCETYRINAIMRANGAAFRAALVACINLGNRAHNRRVKP